MTAPTAPESASGAAVPAPPRPAPTTGDAAVDGVLSSLRAELAGLGDDDLEARRAALDTAHRALQLLLEPDGP